MPIIIPPFTNYQAPLIPIRGLWNNPPPEGDRFIPVEIDWGITTGVGMAVQIAITAFSPVEFSQIVALNVDNGRNGADVDFLFADTGRQLTVPGYCQGLFPVISNAMSFYVVSSGAGVGDITVFEILNSYPPPITVLPSQEQTSAHIAGLGVTPGATTLLVSGSGTLQGFTLTIEINQGAAGGSSNFYLQDANGVILWFGAAQAAANQIETLPIVVNGLKARFSGSLSLVTAVASGAGLDAAVGVTVFYSVP